MTEQTPSVFDTSLYPHHHIAPILPGVTVATKTVGDLFFHVRHGTTDEKVVDEVVKRHVYLRKGVLDIDPSDQWLDLGGNIGTFAVLAASRGATVVAVEPEPTNHAFLCHNASLNKTTGKVFTVQAAVVQSLTKNPVTGEPEPGLLYLCNGETNKYRHTLTKRRGRSAIPVSLIELGTLLSTGFGGLRGSFNAVKLDIEGAELPMLDPGANTWPGINKIVFEYHFDFDRSVPRFRERMAWLEHLGFTVTHAKIPDDCLEYNYYPASRIVWATR